MNGQTQMDFTVHQNSIEVYRNKIQPQLSERKQAVLNAIRYLGGATIREVATHMQVQAHVISGRFSELKKLELIKDNGNRIVNGDKHTIWIAA